ITVSGVTGHKTDTLGVIIATILLSDQEIKHSIHIVPDDFPINYDGIIGADLLQKYGATYDY
ncbi:hypothetical protein EAI_15391, partial [Harpegnathos saltator]